jgi:hypothetical protein
MARYAIFQLSKGKVGDHQIVSEANLGLTHSPQVPMNGNLPYKEIGPRSYGMGWVISSYRGHPLIWHNGGIDGFYALLALLPDENFGVVILTNLLQDNPVPEVVAYHIYDHLLELDPVDWAKRCEERDQKQKDSEEEERSKDVSERKPNTHPWHELKEYAGRYENPGYGTIEVRPDGDGFAATFNKMSFPFITTNTTYSNHRPMRPERWMWADCGFSRIWTEISTALRLLSSGWRLKLSLLGFRRKRRQQNEELQAVD